LVKNYTYEHHALESCKSAFLEILHVAEHMDLLELILEVAVAEVLLRSVNEVAHAGLLACHLSLYGGLCSFDKWDCGLAVESESP
jgi:hypothetical protein